MHKKSVSNEVCKSQCEIDNKSFATIENHKFLHMFLPKLLVTYGRLDLVSYPLEVDSLNIIDRFDDYLSATNVQSTKLSSIVLVEAWVRAQVPSNRWPILKSDVPTPALRGVFRWGPYVHTLGAELGTVFGEIFGHNQLKC